MEHCRGGEFTGVGMTCGQKIALGRTHPRQTVTLHVSGASTISGI
jgi:hypothetical protein